MAFIRILLIFALFYLIIRFISRLLFPPRSGEGRNSFNRQENDREGDVTVEKGSRGNKRIPKDEGDYIDYEEVKD